MNHFTLVRHSAFAEGGDPAFDDAVEVRELAPRQDNVVHAAGGALYDSREAAARAAQAVNDPHGPHRTGGTAAGYFSNLRIGDAEIFVPAPGAPPDRA